MSLRDPSIFSASTICPTLNWTLAKSSMLILGSSAVGGFANGGGGFSSDIVLNSPAWLKKLGTVSQKITTETPRFVLAASQLRGDELQICPDRSCLDVLQRHSSFLRQAPAVFVFWEEILALPFQRGNLDRNLTIFGLHSDEFTL